MTDFDKLILEITTDGRISPEDALKEAAAIFSHHLDVFHQVSEEEVEFEEEKQESSEEDNRLRKLLNMSVNEIELSVRAANCLNNANLTTVGELAMKSEHEMLKYRNFGKKSLNEIKAKMEQLGLALGMNIDQRLIDQEKLKFIMRHRVQKHSLGVSKSHRASLMGNLCSQLIIHGRIKTTQAKAKALRPFAEKVFTMAKKAAGAEAKDSLHLRRQAISRIRNVDAVHKLFDEVAKEFADRNGGYTRIYKLGNRVGDAAEMAPSKSFQLLTKATTSLRRKRPRKKLLLKK